MIIKKYIGKTEEEATARAKSELGENVVIMNVKDTAKKNLLGFLKKPQVEVTVAKEEENERYPYAAAVSKSREEASIRETFRQVAIAAGTEPARADTGKGAGSAVRFDPLLQNENPGRLRSNAKILPKEEEAADSSHKMLVEKLDSLQNMIEKQLQAGGEDSGKEQSAEEEQENSEMMRFMKLLYNTMLENEVNERYANQLIDEVEKNLKPNLPFDYALSDIYQKMILKFGRSAPIERGGKKPRVIFFVGPTGVGKTTTIAKVASKFRVNYNMKVVLITADTYRIAAAEQLRTYANILEVPFRVIYSVEEMDMALRDFSNYDFILVDTAGHSYQNAAQKENMDAFIRFLDGKVETEVHLVVSATTKYRDLVSIVDSYSDIVDYKMIFTKLDETRTYGNLLNLKLYTGASLSYVTFGQNVPDDIEVFNPQKAVKNLLGGKNR